MLFFLKLSTRHYHMYRKPTAYTGRKSSMTLGLPESRKTLKNSVFRFITYFITYLLPLGTSHFKFK